MPIQIIPDEPLDQWDILPVKYWQYKYHTIILFYGFEIQYVSSILFN